MVAALPNQEGANTHHCALAVLVLVCACLATPSACAPRRRGSGKQSGVRPVPALGPPVEGTDFRPLAAVHAPFEVAHIGAQRLVQQPNCASLGPQRNLRPRLIHRKPVLEAPYPGLVLHGPALYLGRAHARETGRLQVVGPQR